MVITIQLRGSSSTETVSVTELMSDYSPYHNLESFILNSTEFDTQGIQMIKVKVNAYVLKNMEHLYFYFGTDELGFDVWDTFMDRSSSVIINWDFIINY